MEKSSEVVEKVGQCGTKDWMGDAAEEAQMNKIPAN